MLKFLKTLKDNIKAVIYKTSTITELTVGQRCQILHAMNFNNMEVSSEYIKIRIGELLKQTKPQKHLAEFYIESSKQNPDICVVQVLNSYLKATKEVPTDTSLFFITQKPHNDTSKNTITSWIKLGLKLAGIDLSLFTPHSTRSAAASAVFSKIPIDTIIKTAGRSSDCTFREFYKRPITNDSTLSASLLS